MICNNCNKENADGSKFCHYCGSKLEQQAPQAPQASYPFYANPQSPTQSGGLNTPNNTSPVMPHPVITNYGSPGKKGAGTPTDNSGSSKTIIIVIIAVVVAAIAALAVYLAFSGKLTTWFSGQEQTSATSSHKHTKDKSDPREGTEKETEAETEAIAEMIEIPECENMSFKEIKAELEGLGLIVEEEHAFSDSVEKDRVISQSVPQGTKVEAGSTIILTVSDGENTSPYEYDQKLTVTVSEGSSYGSAVLYEWKNGDWAKIATYSASVGSNSVGNAREGSSTTPQGVFKLTTVLSAYSVDTTLRTYKVTSSTCVIDDPDSPYYNQIMDKGSVPSGTSYDTIGKGLTDGSTYATIYIEHNGSGFSSENVVPGRGSAIGLRGQNSSLSATYGDVDISASDMRDLLSKLDATKNPVIEIKTK